jgi:putative ABC transport system substrate-binding protein
MATHIGRRKFTAMLGGAVVGVPLTARAQQSAMPVIGFLSGSSPEPIAHLVAAFRNGLSMEVKRDRVCQLEK